MKKVSFCFLVVAFFVLSCGKDSSINNNIEGIWGLTHLESYTKRDGVIVDQEKGDYNPYSPTGNEGLKLSIINTVDSNYSVTYYCWDKKLASWEPQFKRTWLIQGSKVIIDGLEEECSVLLTADTMTLEGYDESDVSLSGLDLGDTVKEVFYEKLVFRKMSDLSEE